MILKKFHRHRNRIAFVLCLSVASQVHTMAGMLFKTTPALALFSQVFSPLAMRPHQIQLPKLLKILHIGKNVSGAKNIETVSQKTKISLDRALPEKIAQGLLFYKDEPLAVFATVDKEQKKTDALVMNIAMQMHEKLASRRAEHEANRLWKITARNERNCINAANDVKMQQDPMHRAQQLDLFDGIKACLWDTLSADATLQKQALCKLYFMCGLEGRLGQYYLNLLNKLAPLAFNANGSFKDLTEYNKQAPKLIARLLEYVYGNQALYHDQLMRAQKNGVQGLSNIIAQSSHASSNNDFRFLEQVPENSKLLMAIYNNPQIYHVLTLDSLCRGGKFEEAEAYLNSKVNTENYTFCRQIYTTWQKRYCNEYGIARLYEKDPLWQSMSMQEKRGCANNKKVQETVNDTLRKRAVCKEQLEKLFVIPEQHSLSVDNFLYDLIGHTGSHEDLLRCLSILHNDAQDKEKSILCARFFNSNGIVKIWEKYAEGFKGLTMPVNLNASDNAQLRTLTNAILLLEPTEQNSAHIKQCLKYIHAATVTEGAAREQYSTYATQLFAALVQPNQNNIILDCPDLSERHATPVQSAIQEFIVRRVSQGMQLTDATQRKKFVREELPLLKLAQQCNYRPQSFNKVHEQFSSFLNIA